MGQKTHPVGLRLGINRKWTSSWYGSVKITNPFGDFSHKQNYQSQGVIFSRGGQFVSGMENFVEKFITRYPFTKHSGTRRLLPVDFRLFKGYAGYRYCFFIYTKRLNSR